MQIAVVVPDDILDDIDAYVPSSFRSRAEVVRHALEHWLKAERAKEIDREYTEAYAALPPQVDDIDSAAAQRGQPRAWDELEW